MPRATEERPKRRRPVRRGTRTEWAAAWSSEDAMGAQALRTTSHGVFDAPSPSFVDSSSRSRDRCSNRRVLIRSHA